MLVNVHLHATFNSFGFGFVTCPTPQNWVALKEQDIDAFYTIFIEDPGAASDSPQLIL